MARTIYRDRPPFVVVTPEEYAAWHDDPGVRRQVLADAESAGVDLAGGITVGLGGGTVLDSYSRGRWIGADDGPTGEAGAVRPDLPRIGPCRDPLELWFLEYLEGGKVFRRYYADRAEARQALRDFKAGKLGVRS